MSTTDPEFEFGRGLSRITLRGRDAIREGGWSIRFLLVARGAAMLLSASVAAFVALKVMLAW
jgi:hypothetical protein